MGGLVGPLESLSRRRVKSRVSLLKQPPGLHDPGRGLVFAAEAGDRPDLATCRCHLDAN